MPLISDAALAIEGTLIASARDTLAVDSGAICQFSDIICGAFCASILVGRKRLKIPIR